MTFKELRKKLSYKGQVPIRWNRSGIVEIAEVTLSGGIKVTNAISKKSFRIPPTYREIDVTILDSNQLVELGSLLPKEMR